MLSLNWDTASVSVLLLRSVSLRCSPSAAAPPRGLEEVAQDEDFIRKDILLCARSFSVTVLPCSSQVCLWLQPPSRPCRGTRGWRCCTPGVWLRWAALLRLCSLWLWFICNTELRCVCLCVSVRGVRRTAQCHRQSGDCFLPACLRCSGPGLSGSGVGVGSQLQVIRTKITKVPMSVQSNWAPVSL